MADAVRVEGPSKGQNYQQIQQRFSCAPTPIPQWQNRFFSEGLSSLRAWENTRTIVLFGKLKALSKLESAGRLTLCPISGKP